MTKMKKSIAALTLGAIAMASNPSMEYETPKRGSSGKTQLSKKQQKVRAKNKAAKKARKKNR
jgi:hypothetical protein